jgi:hypothetical protein
MKTVGIEQRQRRATDHADFNDKTFIENVQKSVQPFGTNP